MGRLELGERLGYERKGGEIPGVLRHERFSESTAHAQATRDIKGAALGLVEKVPHTRKYRLTGHGYSICLVFLKLFERIYAPLAAGAAEQHF